MDCYTLRLLDLDTDLDLFREAYQWRDKPRSHAQPDRMSFADFTAPDGIAVGLFNGELCAVYFLHETEPAKFQCHFTSRRKVSRIPLLTAARQIAHDFFAAGAVELHAWVTPRNRPLRSFLEAVGFYETGSQLFPCQNDTGGSTLASGDATSVRCFVKYVLKGESS
jgi:hypothetical protein